ncbi:MAG TPA: phosphoribosyltransferase family protein [Gammaproteobacteria bacterium]|jgi:hypoxanthine phosphoribosyltransferase
MQKRFVEEQELLEDAYRLAVGVFDSGFRPDFIVGLWRGGSTVGIYVQECLQYLGVETDHIAIRTSYRGREDYLRRLEEHGEIRAHGLQYLFDHLNADNRLLLVDDVYSTGRNIDAVITRLRRTLRRNTPQEIRIAAPWYRPGGGRAPDYYLHETADWLVLPYELSGLTRAEAMAHKPWVVPLLDELRPGWT